MPSAHDIDRLRYGLVLPTLLRLAVPNALAMTMTVLMGMTEAYFIGRLGTTQLAAMALVFPFSILTGMMSAGAMGGGVSSAIARAFGARDTARAHILAMHALLIGTAMGVVYTVVFVAFGPALYRLLGGTGAVLAEAVNYSTVLFSGALLVWISNTLASILRGTGNMRVPSAGIIGAAALQIVLGGVLGLGFGPIPSFGMVGVAVGHIVATSAGVVFFAWYVLAGQGRLRLSLQRFAVRREMLFDILKVGAVACFSPLQTVLAMQVFAGLVARLGVLPLAGYSIGQRLEYLVTPFAFAVGVASVPMIGIAIGAGDIARARRVAWTAGAVSTTALAAVGVLVSLVPDLWARLYSGDEAVLAYSRQYLLLVGPAFAFLGLGTTLYFASQGAGKVLGPVLAGTVRLAIAATVGTWLASRGATSGEYFALVALGMGAFGVSAAAAVKFTRWGPAAARAPIS